jgi:hypothetical protein
MRNTRYAIIALLILAVAAIIGYEGRKPKSVADFSIPSGEAAILDAMGISSSSEDASATIADPESESSSSVPEIPWKEVTLVDQDYTGISGRTGVDWLRAIQTKLIRGNITEGELVVSLARGEDVTSWSAAGMYLAPAARTDNGNPYPDESTFGTHLHFLDAEWRGDCHRHLAPNSSFGVLKGHDAELRMGLDTLHYAKGDDGCISDDQAVINVIPQINGEGLYLGFQPSDKPVAPYMKVVLRYRGDLQATPF